MTFFDWRYKFDEIFQDYSDDWRLNYVHRNDLRRIEKLQSHRQLKREKFAFFYCERCSNHWGSARAHVVFYYPNKKQPLGNITMQIFGQQCRKCSRKNGPYADPIFVPDSIERILEKLHERIGSDFYNKPRSTKKKNDGDDDDLYNIKGEHETTLCEACKLGICTEKKKMHR